MLNGELLYEAQVYPDQMYVFKHALTHEVTYHSILQDRRRELHERAGDAILALHPNSWKLNFSVIASHFERAEAWKKVAKFAVLFTQNASS